MVLAQSDNGDNNGAKWRGNVAAQCSDKPSGSLLVVLEKSNFLDSFSATAKRHICIDIMLINTSLYCNNGAKSLTRHATQGLREILISRA